MATALLDGSAALAGVNVPGSVVSGTLNVLVGAGSATIPNGADTIAVANTAITANSVVLFAVTGAAPDNDAPTVCVELTPGVGFSFNSFNSATPPVAANAAADIVIRWLIAKY
jgi:hypothetical protein